MPIVRSILVLLSLARMALAVEQDHATKMAASQALFDQTVSTILKEHCLRCHGGEKTKSGLDLVTRESLMKGVIREWQSSRVNQWKASSFSQSLI